MMTATYSPEDNKLRLYTSARLPADEYARVRAAGFIFAPKQELFVAPMWTPAREDFLIELCEEIGDEDTSLVKRAEERAERFEDYSEKRADDAQRAHATVAGIVDNIPLGQPILVGHHSEAHARRDVKRIENGMRKAVKMWETSKYWESRAKGAIRAGKYKELPAVRARRIKGLEADKRKEEKNKKEAERFLKIWGDIMECGLIKKKDGTESTPLERARFIANYDHVGVCKNETSGYWSAWDVLRPDEDRYKACPSWTVEQVRDVVIEVHQKRITQCNRWITHIDKRLLYERALLAESGGIASDKKPLEVGGAVQCWCAPGYGKGWAYIAKVNKVTVSVLDAAEYGGRVYTTKIEFDKVKAVMTAAEVEEARKLGTLHETGHKAGFFLRGVPLVPEKAPEETPEHDQKFQTMRDTLKKGVKAVVCDNLFPTPRELAARMVELAGVDKSHRVLEPSAGTGRIVDALDSAPGSHEVAVEISSVLADNLRLRSCTTHEIICADFLDCNGNLGQFDRVLMNPPFDHGSDIKHIHHAIEFLKPGGKLVALCANGPKQREAFREIAEVWEDLPTGTFKASGTNVNVALLVIRKAEN